MIEIIYLFIGFIFGMIKCVDAMDKNEPIERVLLYLLSGIFWIIYLLVFILEEILS